MVNTTLGVQSGDTEQKKRKQTLERAKATHLSRQLQMRLQYAKLKVDHGWQKQNLNEVENLYFRHSHMRGPRPLVANASAHHILSPTTQPVPSPLNTPSQSNLSFRQNSFGLRPSGATPDRAIESQVNPPSTSKIQLPALSTAENVDNAVTSPTDQAASETSPSKSVSFLTSTATVRGTPSAAVVQDSQPTSSGFATPTKSAKPRARPKAKTKVPHPSPASLSPFRQDVFPASPHFEALRTNKPFQETSSSAFLSALGRSDGGSPTKSANAGYGFGNPELTYDSFWSSHSSASNARMNTSGA